MSKVLITFAGLLAFIFSGFAQQQIVFSDKTTESYLLKYITSDEPAQKNINQLISKVALATNKPVYTFNITFSVNRKIMAVQKFKTVKVTVDYSDFKTDKVLYKKFDLSPAFIPASMSISASLTNNKGKNLVVYNFMNTNVDPELTSFNFDYTDSLPTPAYRVKINKTQFFYTAVNITSLNNRIELIDDYYNFNNRMSEGFRELTDYNARNIEMIWTYQTMVKRNNQLIDEVESSEIIENLGLATNDPLFFATKFKDFKALNDQVSGSVENTIANLHQIYYNRGLEFFVNGDLRRAYNLFNESLKVNPSFSPALFQMAKIDYLTGYPHDAALKLTDLFQRQKPDPSTRELALELAGQVIDAFLQIADTALNKAEYNLALADIQDAEDFCYTIREFDCARLMYAYKKEAYSGNYYQMLYTARFNLHKGNTDLAEDYVNKANSYYRTYNEFIGANDSAIALMKEVKTVRYKGLIKTGLANLELKDYRKALKSFEQASLLEDQYKLTPDASLSTYLQKAAKPVILDNLSLISEMVMANDLKKAKTALIENLNLAKKYRLSDDPAISAAAENIKSSIFEQECINTKLAVNDLIKSGNDHLLKKEFLEADKDYREAITLSDDNVLCEIAVDDIRNTVEQIVPAVTYQQGIEDCHADISRRKYADALNQYLLAGKQYEHDSVALFDLIHIPLLDFTLKQNEGFLAFMAGYFTRNVFYDDALIVLSELKSRCGKTRCSKEEKTELGAALAIRDYKNEPSANPKLKVLDYTKGDKWYKQLKKSYLKTWKKTVKAQ